MISSKILQRIISLIPGIIRRDFVRKMIALFFALLVFFTVSYKTGQMARVQGVTVNLILPAGIVCMDETLPKISLKVKGASERRLNLLTPRDFSIDIKVEERKFIMGEPYPLRIDPQDVKSPVGIKVYSVDPSEILLTLDRNISRSIKVQAKFSTDSSLPDGFIIGSIKTTPPEVNITGPSTLINKIETINTDPIPVDKNTVQSFDFSASIALKSKVINVIPPSVMAQVEIVKEDTSADFRSIPIKILTGNDDRKFKAEFISSPHVDITVSGPKSKVKMIKPEQLKAYVDISAFEEPGMYTVDVGCWVDAPVIKAINIYPQKVQIKLTKTK